MDFFQYHPDATRNSANENVNAAMYLEIMDAYEVLKDRKKRRDYDSRLSNPSGARPTYEDYPTTDQPHRSRSDPPNVGFEQLFLSFVNSLSVFFLPLKPT